MKRQLVLSEMSVGLIVDVLHSYRKAVNSGETIADQPKDQELADIDLALDELRGEKMAKR